MPAPTSAATAGRRRSSTSRTTPRTGCSSGRCSRRRATGRRRRGRPGRHRGGRPRRAGADPARHQPAGSRRLRDRGDPQVVPEPGLHAGDRGHGVRDGGRSAAHLVAGCDGYIQKPIDVDAFPGRSRSSSGASASESRATTKSVYLRELNQRLVYRLLNQVEELKRLNQHFVRRASQLEDLHRAMEDITSEVGVGRDAREAAGRPRARGRQPAASASSLSEPPGRFTSPCARPSSSAAGRAGRNRAPRPRTTGPRSSGGCPSRFAAGRSAR